MGSITRPSLPRRRRSTAISRPTRRQPTTSCGTASSSSWRRSPDGPAAPACGCAGGWTSRGGDAYRLAELDERDVEVDRDLLELTGDPAAPRDRARPGDGTTVRVDQDVGPRGRHDLL